MSACLSQARTLVSVSPSSLDTAPGLLPLVRSNSARKAAGVYPGRIDRTTNHTFAGRSASRRMYHLYHALP